MNVLILTSSRDEIDDYYKSIARSISRFLATNDCNLVFGGCSTSMMGICYQEFVKQGREIYSFTTSKYIDDLENLRKSKNFICDTTFELKRNMFLNSDFIVCLPGGVGTYSELLCYIEEKRSNDNDKPIIIYDENEFYTPVIKILKELVQEKFVDANIFDMFSIVRNKNDLENKFYEIKGRVK